VLQTQLHELHCQFFTRLKDLQEVVDSQNEGSMFRSVLYDK
jgi:uncharacterized protein (DUF608 family)